jgi:tetrahydromethanopterin S-methyltransferase subunit A
MIEKPPPLHKRSLLHLLMRGLGRLMKADEDGGNERAVQMMHRLAVAKDWLKGGPLRRRLRAGRGTLAWPVVPGAYVLGDPSAPVAVCVLTSPELMSPLARVPGVAIVGRVVTPNLGIEHIIRNVTTNRVLRFLLLCGKESPVFQPAQALRALLANGVTPDKRIIGAQGPLPVLRNLSEALITAFCRQVELVDCTGTTDPAVLAEHIQALVRRNPGPLAEVLPGFNVRQLVASTQQGQQEAFKRLLPGGKREPLSYDPRGFFIITLNRAGRAIIVRHYLPDQTPAHEMSGRSAESLLLGLLRENLISQMSHAGYLGAELAKAEAALRFGWNYEQDRPLRQAASDPGSLSAMQKENPLLSRQAEGGDDDNSPLAL